MKPSTQSESSTVPLFFSIIIPAYNEAEYIGGTLKSIEMLIFPKDQYEVIVVENGSRDATFHIAQAFAHDHVHVYSTHEGGVSRARNFGMKHAQVKSDWLIFLDADTHLAPHFLKKLETFLSTQSAGCVVGTTSVLPLERPNFGPRLWFAFYNIGHWFTKTSFSIQILKASFREQVHYHEDLNFAEDLTLIKDARRFGSFFYFWSDAVLTSTRRFEHIGWFTLFFKWLYQALVLSRSSKKNAAYDVIR